MTEFRDPRFAELDRLIALEDNRPRHPYTMSEKARHVRRLGGVAVWQAKTRAQVTAHQRSAQKYRKYQLTCACEECHTCRRRRALRKYRAKQKRAARGLVCGTLTCYLAGCRCEACTAANRDARRATRAKQAETPAVLAARAERLSVRRKAA